MLNQQSYNPFIAVIVPITTGQERNIHKILHGLNMQSHQPDLIVISLDRVENVYNDTKQIKYIVSDIPTYCNRPYNMFAGATRNTAISYIMKNYIYDIVVMIDGDCIPQPDLIQSHLNACNKSIPVLSVGKRIEEKYSWIDRRQKNSSLQHLNIFQRDIIINDLSLLRQGLITWGCNLALNKYALKLIIKLNKLLYSEENLFNSIFNGGWGGEDSFLGMQAWIARVFIVVLKSGAVEHIEHLPATNDQFNEQVKVYESSINNLKLKLINNPLPLSFYDYMDDSSNIAML